ncbi:hypothetical protein CXU01_08755 [Akkermansia muciniphila]|uniref:hypothetical protein n=1 Tax=Akkermansia muciniphila TaxID=239935 RepID=UPI000C9C0D72|nr:hypothetical protein [Akkermansia muciniphila]PNC79960.1 hypothetical protein CXU01_08755 [Akkermansia muciniphila]
MSYTPSPVDNTTGAHDTIPAPGGAGNTTTNKTPFYLSKYFWTNLAALLALIIPDVRAWLDSNPIEFFSVLGAVNILLQFISGGKYQLAGEDGQSGQSANPAGALPPSLIAGEGSTSPVEDRSQDPDQDPSSIPPSSGSSSPLSGTSRLMIVLGALMILLGNSCSKDADPVATSVALTDGQVVVIRGGSSLVVDRDSHSVAWSQSTPDVVVVPPVVQATSK